MAARNGEIAATIDLTVETGLTIRRDDAGLVHLIAEPKAMGALVSAARWAARERAHAHDPETTRRLHAFLADYDRQVTHLNDPTPV